jgi:hypothetical protein
VRHYLGVDPSLTYAAGDELGELCPEVDDENQVMFRGHDTPFAVGEQSSHSIGGNPIHLHPDLGSGTHTLVSASDRPTGVLLGVAAG